MRVSRAGDVSSLSLSCGGSSLSPIPLSQEEWNSINESLPDVHPLIERVINWPYVEYIYSPDLELLKRLRLSYVRFRDAVEKLRNAHYAMTQALGVRKYYSAQSVSAKDENAVKADWYSRFYMDYVPLLLCSAVNHCLTGVVELHALKEELPHYKGDYLLKKLVNWAYTEASDGAISGALSKLDSSHSWSVILNYRNDWVHNKPPIVESILYNPPYVHPLYELGSSKMTALGYSVAPDHKWNDLVTSVSTTMSEVLSVLDAATRQWEVVYLSS